MNRTFNVWKTLNWGYSHALLNFGHIVRDGWTGLIAMWVTWGIIMFPLAELKAGIWPEITLILFVSILFTGRFFVDWCQFVVFGQARAERFRKHIFWNNLVWRTCFSRLPIAMILILSLSFIFLLGTLSGGGISGSLLIDLSAFLCAGFFSLHLVYLAWFAAPAIALNDEQFTIQHAWKVWRGNRCRSVVFVALGSGIPIIICASLVLFLGMTFRALGTVCLPECDVFEFTENGFAFYVLASGVVVQATVSSIILLYLAAATSGAMTAAYVSTARKALDICPDYRPRKILRERLEAVD